MWNDLFSMMITICVCTEYDLFIFYIFWEDLATRIIQDYKAYHIILVKYDFVKVSTLLTKPLKRYQYDDFKNMISLIPSLHLPPKNIYEIENGLYIVFVILIN